MNKFFFSFGSFFATAEVIALFSAGGEDQGAFIFWTVLFGLAIAFVATRLTELTASWKPWSAYVTHILAGLLSGAMGLFVLALLIGPWIGAFGAPVFLCWMAGGGVAFFAAKISASSPTPKVSLTITYTLLVAVVLSAVILKVVPALVKAVRSEKQFTAIILRYSPGPRPIVLNELNAPALIIDQRKLLSNGELNDADKKILTEHYPTGILEVVRKHTTGTGEPVKAVIVIDQFFKEDRQIFQPAKGTVYYFQKDSGFETWPQSSPLSKHKVRFKNREYLLNGIKKTALGYMVDNADGSSSGADLLDWSPKVRNNIKGD